MATDIIGELDTQLASLNQMKPPGASKTRITSITQLCVNNIQVESNICQSLYRALKKAPATHKLGAIYVIDSVVRQWIEKAKQNGQDLNIGGRGEPGTYPAAVKRVTELMPALFDDVMRDIPSEQKPKLENMVNIWDKGNTFPSKTLEEFRLKLGTSSSTSNPLPGTTQDSGSFTAAVKSRPVTTPLGFPPRHLRDQGLLPPDANIPVALPSSIAQSAEASVPVRSMTGAPSDVNSILAALAVAAPKATPVVAQQAPSIQAPGPPAVTMPTPNPAAFQQMPPALLNVLTQQSTFQPPPAFSPPNNQFPFVPPNFPGFPPAQASGIAQQFAYPAAPVPMPQAAPSAADPLAPLRGILPQSIINDHNKLVLALSLLQDLQKQGLPMEQWGPILKAFEDSTSSTQTEPARPLDATGGHKTSGAYDRGRDRSRSPDRNERRGGRGSPVYGSYNDLDHRQANGSRNEYDAYRQRSPVETREESSNIAYNGKPMQPKYIAFDNTLQHNHIKVLSRTLFVGGANGTQHEIEKLFEQYGRVQTCISNREKRHAFVKMTTRTAALAAKAGMEDMQARNDPTIMHVARQTKWGVGFGPRECCDYQRGESIIPVHKLTDADMKWLMTAEYGGTGGRAIEGGMVVEEPDIEIGAGVSSKAMSKRVGPEHHSTAKRGGREEKRGGYGGSEGQGGGHAAHAAVAVAGGIGGRKGRDLDGTYAGNHGYGGSTGASMEGFYPRPEPVAVATPPAVPNFGFSLPTGNGAMYR